MTLAIDIRHTLGDFRLDAQFETGGGLTALLGRSGSGKSTIVNVIAGLIRPSHAHLAIDGTVLVDTATGIFVPRHRRRVGYVFQEGRLFPHLSVRQNLLYGRWFAPRDGRREDFGSVVELLGIAALLDRRPGRLSGGEKQRVAIGRALLADPRVLLMDEPLASLDEARKAEILPYIERLRDHARVPIVYVSHSIAEVARLATSVVLLADGRVAAAGPLADIMHRLDLIPLTDRGEAGAVIEAVVERHEPAFDLTELRSRGGLWRLPALRAPVGTRLRLRVRARDVMLATSPPSNVSALNVFTGVVSDIAADGGPVVDIKLDCSGEVLIARLTRFSFDKLGLARGHTAHALVKSVALDRRELGGTVRMLPSADAEASES
ncbi:MAG TPA: molybdenum ABC transporter ATP-binding protein [Hyphomicrobiaceae bacterium]|nr:molybdenum ABC transporter ATP-binding protein [Hyphomicrobiaceae bacterium]